MISGAFMSSHGAGFRRLLDRLLSQHAPQDESSTTRARARQNRAYFYRIANIVRARSCVLARDSWSFGQYHGLNRVIRALRRVAVYWVRYQNQPETWNPRPGSPSAQLRDLLQHLICRYPVPAFLSNSWLDPSPNWLVGADMMVALGNGTSPHDAPLAYRVVG